MARMFILAALLCVALTHGYPTSVKSVPPQCADPTYACQDLNSAQTCDVVKSCITDVWSTMSAPDDDDEICTLCKQMVQEARDQLLSNMTQEELKEVFEGSCKLLPVKFIANACIKLVDQFIPQLVEMLASRMDPNMVCTVSGLCNVANLPIHVRIQHMLASIFHNYDISKCDGCQKFVRDAKDTFHLMTKSEFDLLTTTVCEALNMNHKCDGFFNLFTRTYIYELVAYVDPKTSCSRIGACPIKCDTQENEIHVNDDLTCEFCTHVLEHIKEQVIANSTVEEFRTALHNFCNHTGSFSDKCTELVDQYFDTVIGFIKSLDTKGFCTLLGLCTKQLCSQDIPMSKLIPPTAVKTSIPAMRLIPASLVDDTNSIMDQLPVDRLTHPAIIFNQDLECSICKALSFYIKEDLKEDHSPENVEVIVNNVCSKWVKEFPEHCNTVVNKYGVHMKHRIIDGASFEDICFFAKACPLEENNNEIKVRILNATSNSGPLCDICKAAFDEIEQQLKDPATKANVENLLNQICTYLPASLQDECKSIIDNNLGTIFNILEQELQGDLVCPALKLCTSNSRDVKNVRDIECDLCKSLVQQLKEQLQNPDVKDTVKDLLERGCALLPAELATECKTFVDNNVDNLINILVQEMNPDFVCGALNLCPNTIIQPKNFIECDLCEEVIQQVDSMLKEQRTQEEIKEALEKVCSILPSSMTPKCDHFVDTYSALVISLLAQQMDPKMVCAALKLCPESFRIPKPPKVKDVDCDLCKDIVQKVDDELKDQKTVEAIKEALEKACSILPSSFSAKCTNFINSYSDLIITMLATEMDPTLVCSALQICPAKGLECEGCQSVFHFLQTELMDPNFQDGLKNSLKKICKILPDTYDQNCEAYIDEYGSAVFAIIAQEMDPSVVCVELKVCDSKNVSAIKIELRNEKSFDKCSVCTTVIEYLDKLLEDDNIDKEITAVIEKVCQIVPGSVKDECAGLIEAYGPYLLQMIGQLADSKQVCQDIDFCPRTAGHVHLIGGKKCSYGPAYWCQSTGHAAACKAEMYCKQKL